MSVHTRKDGRVECIYWIAGKQVREPFGRGRDALLKATERDVWIKNEKRQGRVHHFHSDDLTFAELFQQYIAARNVELSDKTVDEICATVALYALPVIGQRMCHSITMNDWNAIQKAMTDRKISNRSVNKYFQYISKVLAWGINNLDELGAMPHPWTRREPLRIVKRFRVELPSLDDLRNIIEHAPEHLQWAIEVEYHTGLRPGKTELFNMKWDDIDFETGAIRVYSSKTDSAHVQYVSPEFIDRLKKKRKWYRQEAQRLAGRRGKVLPECPYVISFQGERITSQVAKSWKEAKAKAGIEKRLRLYDLRHYYISHALANGADMQDLAHRVGHKNANMIVNVYSHLVDEMKSKNALALPSLYVENSVDGAVDNSNILTNRIDQTKKEANDASLIS
ncbi:MAG: site-specific integrase [Syntrophales bacterium]|jgi:integrase|nr:site-specific integrase [Syntrophales bacterium]